MSWDMIILNWVAANIGILIIGCTCKLLAGLVWYAHKKYGHGWLATAKRTLSAEAIFWTAAGAVMILFTTMFVLENINSHEISFFILVFATIFLLIMSAMIMYLGVMAAAKKFERA